MPYNSHIETRPEKCGGAPVFRGTRIPISLINDYIESGHSLDYFAETYNLDIEIVRDVYNQIKNNDYDTTVHA